MPRKDAIYKMPKPKPQAPVKPNPHTGGCAPGYHKTRSGRCVKQGKNTV